jgi:hypothetical protein
MVRNGNMSKDAANYIHILLKETVTDNRELSPQLKHQHQTVFWKIFHGNTAPGFEVRILAKYSSCHSAPGLDSGCYL